MIFDRRNREKAPQNREEGLNLRNANKLKKKNGLQRAISA